VAFDPVISAEERSGNGGWKWISRVEKDVRSVYIIGRVFLDERGSG